ncbi:hypothetical protein CEXT_10801 [Caerostris extrusa]|uniref:Uncharacterized protein n=1 Tax=Caerostris extrusa TaxID=172846 RepID=A0AAV4NTB5_CAEEX|nr:hypothetical protein CEXT_10801 [Caerostris extrusa]
MNESSWIIALQINIHFDLETKIHSPSMVLQDYVIELLFSNFRHEWRVCIGIRITQGLSLVQRFIVSIFEIDLGTFCLAFGFEPKFVNSETRRASQVTPTTLLLSR